MSEYYSNYSVVFNTVTKEVLMIEEFINHLYFEKTLNCTYLMVEEQHLNIDQIKNEVESKQKSSFKEKQIDSYTSDNNKKDQNTEIQYQASQKSDEGSESSRNVEKDEQSYLQKVNKQDTEQDEYDNEEFDSRRRHFIKEFFKYEDLMKYDRQIIVEDFIINILEKKIMSLDKLVVYLLLKQLNKYQIEDAQNFGVDYTLYNLPPKKDDSNEKIIQTHYHSTYLLKINAPFDKWLGYARIAHNVNKKMIIAQLQFTNYLDEDISTFNKVIQNWIQNKLTQREASSNKIEILPSQKDSQSGECSLEKQLIKLLWNEQRSLNINDFLELIQSIEKQILE